MTALIWGVGKKGHKEWLSNSVSGLGGAGEENGLTRELGEVGSHTDKKENKIFLIYEDIQMGSGAKLQMRKGAS